MEHLDDIGDPRLADYRCLTDPAARRRIEGDEFFITEGPVAVERLVQSSHRIRSVMVSDRRLPRLAALLDRIDAPVLVVGQAMLDEVVGFDLHRGVIAAADRLDRPSLEHLATGTRRLAVLEGLNDPENLGAVVRSARAFGVDGLVLDPTCIDPYTRRTVRVSMGEILHLGWCRIARDDWPAAIDQLGSLGYVTWALTPAIGAIDIWDMEIPDRLALMFGAEGPGLSGGALRNADVRVRLPIRSDVDSLNVGAAAAVAFALTDCETRHR